MLLSRKFWIVFSTVLMVAAAFGFYLLVYVKEREGELKEKKFRALEQYATNIKESYKESTKTTLAQFDEDSTAFFKYKAKIDSIALASAKRIDTNSIKLEFLRKKLSDTRRITRDALLKAKQEIVNRLSKDTSFDELLVQTDTRIFFQSFKNTLEIHDLAALLKLDSSVSVSRVGTFTINDRDYLLFLHQFQMNDRLNEHEQWRIYGFTRKDEFRQQARAVELILVLFISLIMVIILIAMPLLKLWVMNGLEKLKMMNIWLTGFSVIVGSSFMFLVILLSNDFIDDMNIDDSGSPDLIIDRDTRLKALADSVQEQFSLELRAIYNQLVDVRKNSVLGQTIREDTIKGRILEKPNLSVHFSLYRSFNETLWIDSKGVMKVVLATHELDPTDPDLNVNLKERKYFSWVRHDSTWQLPDQSSVPEERISLQSIHSYRSGSHEAGIGIPWDKAGVLAIATRLTSVMDPLLPPGYQFCIIDRSGRVWFHSTTEKNLQENFLDETSNPEKLSAAINGRLGVPLDLKYDYKNFRAWVTPIRNMDLFLIAMHDTEYYKSPVVLTSGLTLVMIFLMLLIQGFHQLILYACSVRYSQLKIRTFFLDWMRPRDGDMFLYEKAVPTQLLLLIVLGTLTNLLHSRFLIICLLTLPVYLTTHYYFQFREKKLLEANNQTNSFVLLRQPLFIASAIFIVIINLLGLYSINCEDFVWVILIQLVFVGCLGATKLMSYEAFYNKLSGIVSFFSNNVFRYFNIQVNYNPYVMFIFFWLLLVAVLPTHYFYKVGYYEQSANWARYIQLESAKAERDRETVLRHKLANAFNEQDINDIVSRGNYLDATTEIIPRSELDGTFCAIPGSRGYEILFQASPVITGQVESSRSAIFPASYDTAWSWLETYDSAKRHLVALHYKTKDGGSKYYVTTHEPYQFLKGKAGFTSMLALLLGIFGVYKMLVFCIKHIFGVGLLGNVFLNANTINLEPGGRYFIVGLPYSGKIRLAKEMKKKFDNTMVKEIDLRTDDDIKFPESYSLIILKHFEGGINDHAVNEKKLKIFTKIHDIPEVIVVCLSNMEPQGILEFYDKQAKYYSVVKHDREMDGLYGKCNQALRHWKNVLGGYKVLYKALDQGHHFVDRSLADELDHGEFLPSLTTHISLGKGIRQEHDETVLQIEEMSQSYYHALWNSFCNNEKFILYDLAKDGFVNMRNMKIIRILRQKGVVQFEDSLRIMNASFNNFILSVVNEDEEMKMERQMREKGSWNTLHLVLVIAILSTIVFLGIAQQELFKNFHAILGAVVTLLPVLARFGGVFGGSKEKD